MIEVYFFLAAFTVQILALSVLLPMRLASLMRSELARIPAERLAEVYPEVDFGHAHARFVARYRVANMVVTVLGLVLLGWFLSYMRHPDWDGSKVSGMVTAYFLLQNFPLILIAWLVGRFNRMHARPSPDVKRKATLQRRGLFDFVSPFTVALAALAYLQFAVFMFYVARNPFPGFGGAFANIGIVTLMYLAFASVMYWVMYVRKKGPLETNENRMQVTRFVVSGYAYVCIVVPVFLSLSIARKMLDLETWIPFGTSVSFLVLMLFMLRIRRMSPPPAADALTR